MDTHLGHQKLFRKVAILPRGRPTGRFEFRCLESFGSYA